MADRDPGRVSADVDWREVARLVLTSREMDRIEEEELVPAKKVLYQFSARGHDMAQVLLGLQLKDGDGAFGYYRSRPLLLALFRCAAGSAPNIRRLPAGRRRSNTNPKSWAKGRRMPSRWSSAGMPVA